MADIQKLNVNNTTYDISTTWSKVTGKPGTFPPESHTHSYLPLSGGTMSNQNVVVNLNADLLDGYSGSAYAKKTDLSSYLPLSGGTLTGSLNLGVYDLKFKGSDTGDIVWFNRNDEEVARLYNNNGTLSLRHNAGSTYSIIHSGNIGSQSVNYANSAGSVAWTGVTGKPSTFTPSSHTHDDRYYTETEINNKLTFIKQYYEIDASSLSTSYFYPVIFNGSDSETDCEIHSPNLGGAAAYNQNHIHFILTAQGWTDTARTFTILSRGIYSVDEITIGAIGYGKRDGGQCVWVRGGMKYRFICNKIPNLKTSDYTYGSEVYTVGSNYWGGDNTYVSTLWDASNPQSGTISLTGHTHTKSQITDFPTIPTNTNQLTNGAGFITGITKSMVTSALGYTPPTSDTNTWRPVTNTYTGSDQSTCVSQYGTNALYNALVNGYASSAGSASSVPWSGVTGKPVLPVYYNLSGSDAYSILTNNATSFARNQLVHAYLGHGSASFAMGWVLSGYDSSPYCAFIVNGYGDNWSLVGASAGNWTHRTLLHSGNISSYALTSLPSHSHSYLPLTGGTVSGTITATGFYQSSDERLKTFHDPIKVDLEKLKLLKKNYFKFNDKDKLEIGISAQEIQEIYPEIVSSDDNGYLSVAYDKLSVIALSAIDELDNINNKQQKEIDDLKDQLKAIKNILNEKGIL